jgi:hypothetical protein
MERVVGIGGVFFKATDKKALGEWYRDNLGVPLEGDNYQGSGALAPKPGPRTTALPKKRAVARWKPRKPGIEVKRMT